MMTMMTTTIKMEMISKFKMVNPVKKMAALKMKQANRLLKVKNETKVKNKIKINHRRSTQKFLIKNKKNWCRSPRLVKIRAEVKLKIKVKTFQLLRAKNLMNPVKEERALVKVRTVKNNMIIMTRKMTTTKVKLNHLNLPTIQKLGNNESAINLIYFNFQIFYINFLKMTFSILKLR